MTFRNATSADKMLYLQRGMNVDITQMNTVSTVNSGLVCYCTLWICAPVVQLYLQQINMKTVKEWEITKNVFGTYVYWTRVYLLSVA